MDVVTVVNRTSKVVEGKWDGRPYILQPNSKTALPVIIAEAIKRQNIVMGSEDPYSGLMEYLVGIVEQGDDLSPIEQTKVITRMNRKDFEKSEECVKSRGGMYSPKDRMEQAPLPGTNGPARTDFSSR